MARKLQSFTIFCFCFFFGFFFFFFFCNSIISIRGLVADTESVDCTDRWIHIRQLPSRFNVDLLTNCSQYPLIGSFCPYLSNHGLGPKTHNRSKSWYRTDPLLLELIFHRRMLEYPCLTSDPNLANAIYLPYYAEIDSLKYLYGPDVKKSKEHGMELYQYLSENEGWIWNKHEGVDHFLVMARPAWDFSQSPDAYPPRWGTSFLELPEFYNVNVLVVESRAWPWQEQAVPYLTSFHPPSLALFESWVRRVKTSRRTTLMLFAGADGVAATPNIRRSIRNECENSTNDSGLVTNGGYRYKKACNVVDCSKGICDHDPGRYMRPMLQASFCLQPPGDTPTRRSTFDAIIAGCIPVFFEEQTAKAQYDWHLPSETYQQFAVLLPKEEVVYKGIKILDVLMAMPRRRVRRLREGVIEVMPRIVYRKHGSSLGSRLEKDAFDIAIEGELQRINSRLKRHIF
ncbi:hypothetical protein K2173_018153 [Erythroxylum novogranatense]|uniref:Exostosin GT47 domain-containing protein n=1 Tax=Erythroxylum novogranatense TaxID=1862640 RepID=A0AAV8TNQ8_9ROSI|nr:hypothetical protein K2173_018153 [Erythroxylum novogranatense]